MQQRIEMVNSGQHPGGMMQGVPPRGFPGGPRIGMPGQPQRPMGMPGPRLPFHGHDPNTRREFIKRILLKSNSKFSRSHLTKIPLAQYKKGFKQSIKI